MTALAADNIRPIRAVHNMVQESIGATAGTVWFVGSMINLATDGFGICAADTASQVFLGVATNSGNNTSGADGDLTIKYRRGHQERFAIESTSIDATDIGKTCVIADDNTVSDAATESNDVQCGIVRGIESSQAWVEVGVVNNTAA